METKTRKELAASPAGGGDDLLRQQANANLELAFTVTRNFEGRNPRCPACGTAASGKVALKTSTSSGWRYWKCYRCGERGDALNVLQRSGVPFGEAMDILLGRKAVDVPEEARLAAVPAFAATVDHEAYQSVLQAGDGEAAAAYYATWHIEPRAVTEAGGRYVLDADALHQQLLAAYGRERLVACGLISAGDDGRDYWLVNGNYPMVEPHLTVDGKVAGMQFRPSVSRREQVQAHKAWKRRWSGQVDGNGQELEPRQAWERAFATDPQATGSRVPYVTAFLSLKGAGTDSLLGCGLWRLGRIRPSTVYVVEGFKDLLAARTMGAEAYAIPGTGVMPPEAACHVLARHRVVVALDGDDAGEKGRQAVLQHLQQRGIDAQAKQDMPAGMDVTDILVQRHAHAGCPCPTCRQWREGNPPRQGCRCTTCR